MSKEFMVFVEASDYRNVETSDEESAKRLAVEDFIRNPEGAAFNAEVIRKTDEEGTDTFPVSEVANA